MNKIRLAFLGFRHNHVMGLYKSAITHPRVDVVAAVEEDPSTAQSLREGGIVRLTHETYDELYKQGGFDAVAIGDYFGRRGSLIIHALESGKHVLSDKPICTALSEWERITELASSGKRSIGCLLDLRDHGPYLTMRRLIHQGAIGQARTIHITAQHPLMLGKRAGWYFEPQKHGGTLNDIGIHAIDLIPWLTGRTITEVSAARGWNARLPQFPHFQDAGQMMLRLDNDGGVLADVSYLSPDGLGYTAPQYWRVTVHGDQGLVESDYNARTVTFAKADDKTVQQIPIEPSHPTGCLDAFLDEIEGKAQPAALTTAMVLDSSRRALQIQQASDQGRTKVEL
jgi:predicted dehydrogenase